MMAQKQKPGPSKGKLVGRGPPALRLENRRRVPFAGVLPSDRLPSLEGKHHIFMAMPDRRLDKIVAGAAKVSDRLIQPLNAARNRLVHEGSLSEAEIRRVVKAIEGTGAPNPGDMLVLRLVAQNDIYPREIRDAARGKVEISTKGRSVKTKLAFDLVLLRTIGSRETKREVTAGIKAADASDPECRELLAEIAQDGAVPKRIRREAKAKLAGVSD